ncbi:MAG: DUF4058 family protein [Nitrososphaera sp.]|nr:DUF4058 family protein [Nitrososphaera sp.]
MPSPFPGMDPYLEGYLWPDVHHRLATEICDLLTPQLRPRYVARIEVRLVRDESPEEVRLATVEIRDVAQNELVTSIEILSPVNKREPGLSDYRAKRHSLRVAGVHLLEIDLLRRGQRSYPYAGIPRTPYLVTLTRGASNRVEAWAVRLSDPLPVVPVPLRQPDPDVALDLNFALHAIYERAAYALSVDYSQPPPPPELTAEEQTFVAQLLKRAA